MTTTSPLAPHETNNYQTLTAAMEAGAVALVRTTLAETLPAGTEVAALVAMNPDGAGGYVMAPFAVLVPGNPYEVLADPTEEDDR